MSNVVRVDSNYKIQVVGGGTITLDTGTSGTVLVTGNLDVRGSNTAITTNVVIEDNILTVNYGEEGSSISEGTGGLEIDRGTNPDGNAFILFDETQTWNDPVSNTIKNGVFVFRTDAGINGIQTNSINTNGGDLFLINQGTGKISVSGTVNYENQVTDEDDIPNKKYVDDLVASTLVFGQSTGIADGNTYIQVFDDTGYAGVSKATVNINSTEVANFQEAQIDFFNLRFSGTRIETTLSNADIFLTIPGTGTINLQANAEVTDNLSVLGNATVAGNLTVTGNYFVSGISIVDNVEITGNTIQNIVTNNDLNLTTIGTGVVRVLSSLTVDNNVVVTGNLTVNGSTTTVNSTTLTVDDKNIELASTASPSDALADGGGITLRGTTDKTILYNNSNGRWETNIGLTVGGALSVTPANASVTLSPTGTGTVTVNPATAGSIDNVNIGASTRGTGAFTTLGANSTVNIDTTTNNQSYTTTGAGTITITSGTAGNINNMNIGATTRGTGAFTTLAANGNVTLGDADTDTITVGASFVTGTVLRSAKANTNTLALAAYDVDGTVYTNLITLTASNTPTLTLTSTGVGSINNMNIGASTRGTGAFTTLAANSTVNIDTTTNNQSYTTTGAGTITMSSGTTGSINNMQIGNSTRASGAFTSLDANGNVTLGDADTDTITIGGAFVTGTVLRSAKSNGNTLNIAAYDVDGSAYTNLITLTASNTPTIAITSSGVGSIDNINIGASTRGTGAFTTLAANGNVTLGDADTDTITVGASFVTGTVLRSAKADTNTLALAAYDVDGAVYTNLITLTASNTPTLTLTSTGVGSINNMNIGASTRGTGAFTTLDANSTVTLSPANTTVTISPSGTGSVTIAPATTLTLGTSGQTTTMNGTTITMANATGVAINGANPTISSTSTGTLTLFNANIATVDAFQAATVLTIGATTGTMTLRNATVALSGSGTMAVQGTTNDSITRKDYVDSMAIAMTVALSVL